MATASVRLVEYLMQLQETDLTSELLQQATMAVLDNGGCGLYGSRQSWDRIVREFVLAERGQGHATLYGSTQTVSPARAALANGTATHGFELDDIVQGALTHPGAVVVSAALAVGEECRASGPRLLLAVMAGYEMMARLGLALGAVSKPSRKARAAWSSACTPGHAAEAGVVACELARRGFTGPREGIDGRYGLLEVIGGSNTQPGDLRAAESVAPALETA